MMLEMKASKCASCLLLLILASCQAGQFEFRDSLRQPEIKEGTLVDPSSGGEGESGAGRRVQIEPLSIQTPSLPNALVGAPYQETLRASGGTPPYQWSLVGGTLPPGLGLKSATGQVLGNPAGAGDFTFTVQVDGVQPRGSVQPILPVRKTLKIVVKPALTPGTASSGQARAGVSPGQARAGVSPGQARASAPHPAVLSITTGSLPDAVEGIRYSLNLLASGGTPSYKWTREAGTMPPGLELSTGGTLSGTPTKVGTYSFTVKVTDSALRPSTFPKEISLVVKQVLAIATASLPAAKEGTTYSQSLVASGGRLGYTWSIESGKVPAGLKLDEKEGTLSGIPATGGTYNFTVKVTDSASSTVQKAFSILVNSPVSPLDLDKDLKPIVQNVRLTVTTRLLADGSTGIPYQQSLSVSGGKQPYRWSIVEPLGRKLSVAEKLPPGLTLSTQGIISGTPKEAGTYEFAIKVGDGFGGIGQKAFSIVVKVEGKLQKGLEPAPTEQKGRLTITTTTLPEVSIGSRYRQDLTALGGRQPYRWSLVENSTRTIAFIVGLPRGLTLSSQGIISGTPAATGSYAFTVKVEEAAGGTIQRTLAIVVKPKQP